MQTRQELIRTIVRHKAECLKSAILAKAILRLADGSIRIATVYTQSTRYEFYWIHKTRTKSTRALRNKWVQVQSFARDFGVSDARPYTDFRTFVKWYAARNQAEVLLLLVYKKRRLAAVQKQADHESLGWDETPQIVLPNSFDYQNKLLHNNLKGAH